jgi:hypothetical protein
LIWSWAFDACLFDPLNRVNFLVSLCCAACGYVVNTQWNMFHLLIPHWRNSCSHLKKSAQVFLQGFEPFDLEDNALSLELHGNFFSLSFSRSDHTDHLHFLELCSFMRKLILPVHFLFVCFFFPLQSWSCFNIDLLDLAWFINVSQFCKSFVRDCLILCFMKIIICKYNLGFSIFFGFSLF